MERWVIGTAILFLWVAAMILVTWLSTKYRRLSVTDYATTGGTLGLLTLFLTYSATYHSSYAFMGTTGAIYTHGIGWWNNIHWTVMPGIFLWILGKRVWALGKRRGYLSIGQFTAGVYESGGTSAKMLGLLVAVISIVFVIPYTAMQALGISYLFQIVSDGRIGFTQGLVIFIFLMVFITWLGGMRGVAWTDTVQGIFMLVAMWVGGYMVVSSAFGGILNTFAEGVKSAPEAFSLPGLKGAYTYRFWVSQWTTITIGMIAMPHIFIRYFAGKSLHVLKWSAVFSSLYLTFLYIFVPAVGIVAKLVYPSAKNPDMLFPELLLRYTPFALAAFAMAGAMAAALSTADSQLHAASSVFTVDVYKPYFKRDADERHLYHVDRAFVLIFGVICAWIAFQKPGLFLNILQMTNSGTAAMAPVIFLPLFWEKSNAKAALTAVIVGELIVLFTTFILPNPLGILSGLWGLLGSTALFVGLSLIFKGEASVRATVKELKTLFVE
jgi:SSS family solute:Na+ symporter